MRLYKYVHPDRVDILKNAKIRFTQPAALNDPFEMSPVLDGIFNAEMLSSLASSDEFIEQSRAGFIREARKHPLFANADEEHLIEFFERARPFVVPFGLQALEKVGSEFVRPAIKLLKEQFLNQIGVLCLSEVSDSRLMWGHYADSHRGFVVEFDATHPFFDQRRTASDDLRSLQKVVYSDTRPTISVLDMNPSNMFLTKGSEWSYEREWRILMWLPDAPYHLKLVPHDAYLFDLPKGSVTRIILGSRASKELEDEILDVLDSSKEFRGVGVSKAVLAEGEYGISFEHVLRYNALDLEDLLDEYFPVESKVSTEGYIGLVVDLVMVGVVSLDAVDELLARYSPVVLDNSWLKSRQSLDDSIEESVVEKYLPKRSAIEILHEILSLHFGAAWEDYISVRSVLDRQPKVDEDPMKEAISSFPREEFTNLSKELLPKVLGVSPEELEEMERKMKGQDMPEDSSDETVL